LELGFDFRKSNTNAPIEQPGFQRFWQVRSIGERLSSLAEDGVSKLPGPETGLTQALHKIAKLLI
jgi:hypothetical protein